MVSRYSRSNVGWRKSHWIKGIVNILGEKALEREPTISCSLSQAGFIYPGQIPKKTQAGEVGGKREAELTED